MKAGIIRFILYVKEDDEQPTHQMANSWPIREKAKIQQDNNSEFFFSDSKSQARKNQIAKFQW